ncbi:hypothetical protein, partial [Pantoea sp. GbtcB22]|uniref:hypothetical protein n=1 Tax=Pantoea sp. GbtcB22 TaxID=2824767 RepID=UPI001C307E6A
EALGRRVRRLRTLWIVPGLALFLVVAGAWPVYVYFTQTQALGVWRTEYLGRYFGTMSGRFCPFWYYLPLIFGLIFLFLAFLPEAVAAPMLPR